MGWGLRRICCEKGSTGEGRRSEYNRKVWGDIANAHRNNVRVGHRGRRVPCTWCVILRGKG